MFFWLKKLVSFWLMPLSISVVLMGAGLVCIYSARRAKLGRGMLIAGFAVLLFFSHNGVSAWLVQSLERRYPPIPSLAETTVPAELARCRYVVVLGGGHGDMASLSATNKLSPNALGRIVEGVRLLRVLPGAKLVVTGPSVGGNPSHASVLANAAIELGVDSRRIILIEDVRDTEDESVAVRNLVAGEPVALVTSAWHLPRAAALFRKTGGEVFACPTDFLGKANPEWHWKDVMFSVPSLENSTLAVRERIGYVWVWLRGKT